MCCFQWHFQKQRAETHYFNILIYSDKRKTFHADSHFSCFCFQCYGKLSIAILILLFTILMTSMVIQIFTRNLQCANFLFQIQNRNKFWNRNLTVELKRIAKLDTHCLEVRCRANPLLSEEQLLLAAYCRRTEVCPPHYKAPVDGNRLFKRCRSYSVWLTFVNDLIFAKEGAWSWREEVEARRCDQVLYFHCEWTSVLGQII